MLLRQLGKHAELGTKPLQPEDLAAVAAESSLPSPPPTAL